MTEEEKLEAKKFYSENIKCWIENPRHCVRKLYIDMLGNVSGKRIIDVGCGCGYDIDHYLSKRGAHGIGLDFCEEAYNAVRGRIREFKDWKIVHTDMMQYIPDDEKFDIVIFSMVVMHYHNLSAIFEKLSSFLKPGGLLLLVTNNPYLICKEYDLSYPDADKSVSYQHHFFHQGKELTVTKYAHSISNYINTAFHHGLVVNNIQEFTLYNEETQFFNPVIPNPPIPNILSILYEQSLQY